MRIVTLDQRSDEWLAWRRGGIGASEAAVIMGISPFKTKQELWEQKLGMAPGEPMNPAMQRGVDLEDEARALFIKMSGMEVFPICGEHEQMPFLRVSYDGITFMGDSGVEIKVPGEKTHLMALSGKVPGYYWCQIQHQMLVGDMEEMKFFSYRPEMPDPGQRGAIITVARDDLFLEKYVAEATTFWEHVQSETPPCGEAWLEAARLWLISKNELDLAKAVEAERKDALILLFGDQEQLKAGGVSVSRSVRKGGLNHDAIYRDYGIDPDDLERYRGDASESIGVRASSKTAVGEAVLEMEEATKQALSPPDGVVSTAKTNEVLGW